MRLDTNGENRYLYSEGDYIRDYGDVCRLRGWNMVWM